MQLIWLRKLRYFLSVAIATLLVLLAVAFILLRMLVAYAPDFRADAEALLSETLNRPITLGGLRAEWSGRDPRLILEDVSLAGEGALTGVGVQELEVSVDLWESLTEWRLVPGEITISGLDAAVLREADGKLRLRIGDVWLAEVVGQQARLPRLPAGLHLRDARLEVDDRASGFHHRFEHIDLRLTSADDERFVLAGSARLPTELGDSVAFRTEWQGMPRTPQEVNARLYIDLRGANLAAAGYGLPAPALGGVLDAQLWAEVVAGAPVSASAVWQGQDMRVAAGHFEELAGRASWQRQGQGWELRADRLRLRSGEQAWPPTRLHVSADTDADGLRLRGAASYIDLASLTRFALGTGLAVEPVQARLRALNPRGVLHEPGFELHWRDGALQAYSVSSRFSGLSLAPVAGAPGVAGLAGLLRANSAGGGVEIDGRGGHLALPRLFRAPLEFQRLQGRVNWRRDGAGWRIEGRDLRVDSTDGTLAARGRVFLHPERGPYLDLRAHLRDGDGRALGRYLPTARMKPKLVAWLDQAIGAGRVPDADLILFGPAKAFPFDSGQGVFEVQARAEDVDLHYFHDWPLLENAAGSMRFAGRSMQFELSAGELSGARVQRASARIDDTRNPVLAVDAETTASGGAVLDFLRAAPITSGLRPQLELLRLEGEHELGLQIELPLREPRRVRVDGTLRLNGGGLAMPSWGVALSDLTGELRFDERGASAQKLQGKYSGQPVKLTVATLGEGTEARVHVWSELIAAPHQLWRGGDVPYVSGTARYAVEAIFPGFRSGAKGAEFWLRSQLKGLGVSLPAPLAKSADVAVPFELGARFGPDGLAPLLVHYGRARALVELLPGTLRPTRGVVRFGPGELALPAAGWQASGPMEALDLDGWRRFAAGGEGSGGAGSIAVDAEVAELRMLGQSFRDTRLQVRRAATGLELEFGGPDLAGTVAVQDQGGVDAQLERVHWRQESAQESGLDALAPAEVPPVRLEVADFQLGTNHLGRISLELVPQGDGVELRRALIDNPVLDANLSGFWRGGDAEQSRLDLSFSSINAGDALALLGYPGAVRGGLAEGQAAFRWPGAPTEFSLLAVTGKLDVRVLNGRIVKVEPGAGRLFGLLSVATLPRRLSLDFSDLFAEGFAFDEIDAHFTLEQGDAQTRRFVMEGPAARVDLKGRVGLAARDYDQIVVVTPNVSSTLPAVGAIAGGPAGALVAFVAQQVLKKQINRLGRYRYRVTGSWDEPTIEGGKDGAPTAQVQRTEQ